MIARADQGMPSPAPNAPVASACLAEAVSRAAPWIRRQFDARARIGPERVTRFDRRCGGEKAHRATFERIAVVAVRFVVENNVDESRSVEMLDQIPQVRLQRRARAHLEEDRFAEPNRALNALLKKYAFANIAPPIEPSAEAPGNMSSAIVERNGIEPADGARSVKLSSKGCFTGSIADE